MINNTGVENPVPKTPLKDGGSRTTFETGATRERVVGNGRFDLLPFSIISKLLAVYRKQKEVCVKEFPSYLFNQLSLFQLDTQNTDILYLIISEFIKENFYGFWEMLFELAKHYENGALKYAERNWEKGIPLKFCIDSALRHYTKFKMGLSDEPHAIAFIWNLIAAIYTVQNHPEICGDFEIKSSKDEEN